MEDWQLAELARFLPRMLAGDMLRQFGHEMTPEGVAQVTEQATDDKTLAQLALEEALMRKLSRQNLE